MKTYRAYPDEAARIASGQQTLIVLPMPQPPKGCVYIMNGNGDKACCYCPSQDLGNFTGQCWVPPTPTSKDHLLPAPYRPGDIVAICDSGQTHSSPSWTPVYGSVRILTVESKLLTEITEEQCFAAGVLSSVVCPGCEGKDEGCCVCDHTGRVKVGGGSLVSAQLEFAIGWHSSHPDLPWESAWAFFYGIQKEGD